MGGVAVEHGASGGQETTPARKAGATEDNDGGDDHDVKDVGLVLDKFSVERVC